MKEKKFALVEYQKELATLKEVDQYLNDLYLCIAGNYGKTHAVARQFKRAYSELSQARAVLDNDMLKNYPNSQSTFG